MPLASRTNPVIRDAVAALGAAAAEAGVELRGLLVEPMAPRRASS